MIEVPRTPRGPDTQALEALLLKYRPRALFINSFYHNPTGSSLTPVVAQQVLQLTKAHGVLVIEDDVYADLHSGPGTRLAALGIDDNVIYVGSYSKTLSSSLRLGFVVAGAGVGFEAGRGQDDQQHGRLKVRRIGAGLPLGQRRLSQIGSASAPAIEH